MYSDVVDMCNGILEILDEKYIDYKIDISSVLRPRDFTKTVWICYGNDFIELDDLEFIHARNMLQYHIENKLRIHSKVDLVYFQDQCPNCKDKPHYHFAVQV